MQRFIFLWAAWLGACLQPQLRGQTPQATQGRRLLEVDKSLEWLNTVWGSSTQTVATIAHLSSGFLIGGEFEGEISCGDSIFTNVMGSDGYIAKLGEDGACVAARLGTGMGGLVDFLDAGGDELAVASLEENFRTQIWKFTASFDFSWKVDVATSLYLERRALRVHTTNIIFFSGVLDEAEDVFFGETPLSGVSRAVVASYAGDGSFLWAKTMDHAGGVSDYTSINAFAFPPAEPSSVIAAGDARSASVTLFAAMSVSALQRTGFLIQLDFTGTVEWVRVIACSGDPNCAVTIATLEIDEYGYLLLSGEVKGSMLLNGVEVLEADSTAVPYVARFAPDGGSVVWIRRLYGAGGNVKSFFSDHRGGMITIGLFPSGEYSLATAGGGSTTFDVTANPASILLKLHWEDGSYGWHKEFPGTITLQDGAVSRADGSIVVVGALEGSALVDGISAASSGGSVDGILGKFNEPPTLAFPVIDPPFGTHMTPVNFTLTSPTEGVRILYTTDGSTPSRDNCNVAENGVSFNLTFVGVNPIRAITARDFWTDSSMSATTLIIIPRCGDGKREGVEECDDGNILDGDGCTSACLVEVGWQCLGGNTTSADSCDGICGDSRRVGTELCDDGNTVSWDGCSGNCSVVEEGWTCSGGNLTQIDVCAAICGDGLRVLGEDCDDGNKWYNDGCSPQCRLELGWNCTGGNRSHIDTCFGICGDGMRVWSEICDDGNLNDWDGCSSECQVEVGWACDGGDVFGADSCEGICGDGRRVGAEECDDGNFEKYDGCTPQCTVMPTWACEGGNRTAPDVCVVVPGFVKNPRLTVLSSNAVLLTVIPNVPSQVAAVALPKGSPWPSGPQVILGKDAAGNPVSSFGFATCRPYVPTPLVVTSLTEGVTMYEIFTIPVPGAQEGKVTRVSALSARCKRVARKKGVPQSNSFSCKFQSSDD